MYRLMFLVLALVLVIGGMSYLRMGSGASATIPDGMSVHQIADATDMTLEEKTEAILSRLTLTEKVGQMVAFGINGQEADQNVAFALSQFHYGSVVLFDRNMSTISQVKKLTGDLQRMGGDKLPMFICIDEEGGVVSRMKDVLQPPPAPLDIGNTGNPDRARESAENISLRLRAMGINVNFAPVADLGSLGRGRHFSHDPQQAADFVSKACDGYQEAGMLCSLKHFPGIGKGQTDSHNDSVVVDVSRDTLYKEDMIPFQQALSSHSHDGIMVMVSHVTYPQLADGRPASISQEIMKELLRERLGFRGVIITDDLEMGAIDKYYSNREKGLAAVKAGADMVMMCHDYQHAEEMYMGILDAVKSGELSEDRINESVRRIIRAKLKYNIKMEMD